MHEYENYFFMQTRYKHAMKLNWEDKLSGADTLIFIE